MRASRTGPRPRMAILIACAAALAVFVAPLSIPVAQAQDALEQARDHYKRGNELFARGDYEAAIAEFAEADNLAPSPTLEFNIALCYDRLGDRAEALRRYQLYLRAAPGAANRATVEAKIRRLQGELRQESEARAAAAPTAAPTPATTPTPAPATTPAPTTTPAPAPTPTPVPETDPQADYYDPAADPAPPTASGPSMPGYDANAASNDPELARVAAIDVASIRDQRAAGGFGRAGAGEASSGPGEPMEDAPGADSGKKKASKPIYKQWWFWVVAGVSVIILIDFATQDSGADNQRLILEPQNQAPAPGQGGLEWRF